jgi:hypothetical protein
MSNLVVGPPSSHPLALSRGNQRDKCKITLFVGGILVIIAAVSVGVAGLTHAISLGLPSSLAILIGGSIIGSALIIVSIYKRAIYNRINGLPSATRCNDGETLIVESIRTGVKYSQGYSKDSSTSIVGSGWKGEILASFTVKKQTVDANCDRINAKLDELSKQSIRVFVHAQGATHQGGGEINVRLVTFVEE